MLTTPSIHLFISIGSDSYIFLVLLMAVRHCSLTRSLFLPYLPSSYKLVTNNKNLLRKRMLCELKCLAEGHNTFADELSIESKSRRLM